MTAGLEIMIVGYFIEYSKNVDWFIFVMILLILIPKSFYIVDLFFYQKVSDPSFKYQDNNYKNAETFGYMFMYQILPFEIFYAFIEAIRIV